MVKSDDYDPRWDITAHHPPPEPPVTGEDRGTVGCPFCGQPDVIYQDGRPEPEGRWFPRRISIHARYGTRGVCGPHEIRVTVEPAAAAVPDRAAPTEDGPWVEIGGETMTQAQFDAARHPLLAPDPGPAMPGDEMTVTFGPAAPTEGAGETERPGQPGKNEGDRAGLVGRADTSESPSSPPDSVAALRREWIALDEHARRKSAECRDLRAERDALRDTVTLTDDDLEACYESARFDGQTGAWHPHHHAVMVREVIERKRRAALVPPSPGDGEPGT